ncbi:GNAT family N-acetyltransferase [Photobacterium galatheae]|uniref:Acetyltransferase n=1 Tax=Photobacterium galatheae TaxID=1654360 RepID=A0A066RMK2_9GAMM|nr:GNAT family N-acetyltransferase [Photobacterium galatheae]KDM91655.1 acetyltransferase [Photobacterium galatheae]MCM0149729.1 GNAT family N-acetyltransferase [Photobacterium galatheae]
MYLRKASENELDWIYRMGFDAWGNGLSMDAYLEGCRKSTKYQSGTWYVLTVDGQPVASLIVYSGQFALQDGCFGIGSVATAPEMRSQGYGSQIVRLVAQTLFEQHGAKAVYLHSDIGHAFYQKLGFSQIQGTNCFCKSAHFFHLQSSVPSYF